MDKKTNFKPLILAGLLFVVLLLIAVTYRSMSVITEKTIINHQRSIAAEAAKTTELWLKQHVDIIEATSKAVMQVELGNNQETLRLLKIAMDAGEFSDVYIGLADGTMIDGADWQPPHDYDPRHRPWYRAAVSEGKTAFTRPYIDMTTWKLVIALVSPLFRNGRFIGVISSDIILDTLQKNVVSVKIGKSGYSFIVDSKGIVLVHPEQELVMKVKIQDVDSSLKGILEQFKSTTSGTYAYKYQNENKVLTYQKISNTDWFLCTTVSEKEAQTLVNETASLLVLRMVLFVLLVFIFLTLAVIVGSAIMLVISKRRFRMIVKQHQLALSDMDEGLKWETSRRKEVESRYLTLFNVANDAILLSRGLMLIECNDKAMDLFGLPKKGIIGRSILDLSPKYQTDSQTSEDMARKIISDAMAGKQLFFNWTYQCPDGTEFPTEVSLKTLYLDNEKIVLSSIRDISKRVNAEEQLRHAQKLAAMGEMLGVIAHQWRQPLNTLSSYIASLPAAFYNQCISKEFVEKLVDGADSQIQFMSRTIDDFRNFFKPSKHKAPFDIMEAIENAVKLMEPQLSHQEISLRITGDYTDRGICVYGYKSEFVHVLVNIIANAIDAIKEKRGQSADGNFSNVIEIHVSREGQGVNLEFKDDGCGIPEHLLDKIFTPYFTTKEKMTYSGIGLYMAKIIVEKEMNGSLTAKNHSTGAQFTIHLLVTENSGM